MAKMMVLKPRIELEPEPETELEPEPQPQPQPREPTESTAPRSATTSASTSTPAPTASDNGRAIPRRSRSTLAEKRAAKTAKKAARRKVVDDSISAAAASTVSSCRLNLDFGMTEKRLRSVFAKELRKRETGGMKSRSQNFTRGAGDHEVSAASLRCEHAWSSSGAAGIRCQICNFETKDKSYNCKQPGCEIKLCGSCQWKWTHN